MLPRLVRLGSMVGIFGFVIAGCDVESSNVPGADSGPSPTDAGSSDLGRDMAMTVGCDDNGDCDDRVDCTTDLCEVGNVCRNVPDDSACATGQRCNPRGGCGSNECTGAADCDDGQLCNGRERCVVGMCYPAELAETCDDGVDCTMDRCDDATNRCVRELGPGCMPEAGPRDGGVAPFDPARDYTGSFTLFPAQSAECAVCRVAFSSLSFSVSSDTLTVVAGGSLRLTQTPVPTGPEFDVSGSDACASIRLAATFSNRGSFSGRWTGAYEGGSCGTPDNPVSGTRM